MFFGGFLTGTFAGGFVVLILFSAIIINRENSKEQRIKELEDELAMSEYLKK